MPTYSSRLSLGPAMKLEGRPAVKRGGPGCSKAAASLQFLPRDRAQVAAVLRDVLLHRLGGVQDNGRAVRELDVGLALDDESAQEPEVAVHVEIALDVDHALVAERTVQLEVAVDVEEALAVPAV